MSWIVDNSLSWFQRFCINILKCGPIPKHVAIIMDGNRRFAKKNKVEKKEGHSKGFDKLAEALLWCRELGIKEVTVYAFSIENFKRSEQEVNTLLDLAKDKFRRLLLEEKDKLMQERVCIRIIGDISLLPNDLQKMLAEVVLMTKDNDRAVLNVAFAYTSRDEITNAIKTVAEGTQRGDITTDDITEDLLTKCMYTNKSSPPEILVRTSGEVRFSDYLLWQISNTRVFFTDVLWPEFCIWHLLACVFQYQRSYNQLQKHAEEKRIAYYENHRVDKFLENIEENRTQTLEMYVNA